MPEYRLAGCDRLRVDVNGRMRKAATRNVFKDSRRKHLDSCEHQGRVHRCRDDATEVAGGFRDCGLRQGSVREPGERRDPTAIINLYSSTKATAKFVNPGTYYSPPTRQFSFDSNFNDPGRQPPGMPSALVPIRYNWAVPPPNTVNYSVVP